jgi:type II secretory pathway pseudopilin PulG
MGADRRRRERGFALVAVLWLLLLLSIIGGVMLVEARSERRQAATEATLLQARLTADAGIDRAILSLVNGGDAERWRLDGTPRALRLFDRDIEVRIESEAGKIDLNAAPPPLLAALFRSQGMPPAEAEQLAGRVAAWRTPLRPAMPDDAADPYKVITHEVIKNERLVEKIRQTWPIEIGKNQSIRAEFRLTADPNNIKDCTVRLSKIASSDSAGIADLHLHASVGHATQILRKASTMGHRLRRPLPLPRLVFQG